MVSCEGEDSTRRIGTLDMFDGNYVSAHISVPKGRAPLNPRSADAAQVRHPYGATQSVSKVRPRRGRERVNG